MKIMIFDTNIVSEFMKPVPSPKVIEWANNLDDSSVYLTAVTVGEIVYGLERLGNTRRRKFLQESFEGLVIDEFAGKILSFDAAAGYEYGHLVAKRDAIGRPISIADAQIAAICKTHDALLATRNIDDFESIGIEVVNPFV